MLRTLVCSCSCYAYAYVYRPSRYRLIGEKIVCCSVVQAISNGETYVDTDSADDNSGEQSMLRLVAQN